MMYSSVLPQAFPYQVELPDEVSTKAVEVLMERTEQFTHGSSFAITADLYDAQLRRFWLSRSSLQRLIDAGLVEVQGGLDV
jgi:hypothetical protein